MNSKAYSMATQLFKLGLGFFIAAPKAILTALGTPYLFKFFENKETNTQNEPENININFKGKSFLKLLDFTPEEIGYLLDLAAELKAKKKADFMPLPRRMKQTRVNG